MLVDPLFCLTLAAGILLFPLRWILAWLCAVAVHELSHLAALKLMGCRIRSFHIGPMGVQIYTDNMIPYKELLCAVAGPAGSFLLLSISRWMPLLAICGCLQGMYNILPIYPMDGGRAVKCLLTILCNERIAAWIGNVLSSAVILTLLIFGIFCLVPLSLGPIPMMLALVIAVRTGKIPCKTLLKRVQ